MDVSFFQEILTKISERGRQILDLSFIGGGEQETLESLCHALVSSRGEASGVALARQILQSLHGVGRRGEKSIFLFFGKRVYTRKTGNCKGCAGLSR